MDGAALKEGGKGSADRGAGWELEREKVGGRGSLKTRHEASTARWTAASSAPELVKVNVECRSCRVSMAEMSWTLGCAASP